MITILTKSESCGQVAYNGTAAVPIPDYTKCSLVTYLINHCLNELKELGFTLMVVCSCHYTAEANHLL